MFASITVYANLRETCGSPEVTMALIAGFSREKTLLEPMGRFIEALRASRYPLIAVIRAIRQQNTYDTPGEAGLEIKDM